MKLIRICLIAAIVFGLAAGALTFTKVQDIIVSTRTERDDFHKDRDKEKGEKVVALGKLKKTEAELAKTKTKLCETEADLKTATAKVIELDKKVTDMTAVLEKTKADRDAAQQELARWDGLGVKPEEVRAMMANKAKAEKERNALVAENKILLDKIKGLDAELADYRDPNRIIPEPPGTKGKIVAVDPKFNFVVLDIGRDKGILERGELLINRNGKLIGKVRIATVKDNRSIANIIQGWQQAEVMEGDQVMN